ncbi:hypothetical protein QJS10_CPB20g01505 [Acorus calamus]|uniref:Ubiquitin-like domain-containing protein n=1 Tax=Acorus calamus TaxID=4465 RepID=A0AAV9CAE6_ACOCL|nr:hypothetical protein QJS10_CPB20g01505 [Acorus calamus]
MRSDKITSITNLTVCRLDKLQELAVLDAKHIWSIETLKNAIDKHVGVPPHRQRLEYMGVAMKEGDLISDSGWWWTMDTVYRVCAEIRRGGLNGTFYLDDL